MVRVVGISDIHNFQNRITLPGGDVLICAGDATINSTKRELRDFASWFATKPHPIKIFIPGNHDYELFNYQFDEFSKLFDSSIHLMIVGGLEVDGVKIYCCAPPGSWAAIPPDTDILVTHYPPFGILDEIPANSKFNHSNTGINIGSKDLLRTVKKIKPRYHLFGHIHECAGVEEIDGTIFMNCAMVDEHYRLAHDPLIFDIERKPSDVRSILEAPRSEG